MCVDESTRVISSILLESTRCIVQILLDGTRCVFLNKEKKIKSLVVAIIDYSFTKYISQTCRLYLSKNVLLGYGIQYEVWE